MNLLIFLLSMSILGLLLFSLKAEGYDDQTTHPGLTDEIVDFYNLSFENKITNEEKEWIVKGSIDEDIPPRWINHFYDPVHNEGWLAENLGDVPPSTLRLFSKLFLNINSETVSSVNWLHNESLQAKYASYGGNNTWENAIRQYADGNRQEAFYVLGHILHLLEDKTVPDHTRNDTHAHEGTIVSEDGGSPYEDYCSVFTRSNLKIAQKLKQENAKPVILSSVDFYFYNLASYSNNYFFSEHTINSPKYNNPKIIREDEKYGYGKDKNSTEFPLVKISFTAGPRLEKIKVYSLADEKRFVLSSYFSRLSREAVLNGAGAIKLFLDEAEKAKNDKESIPSEPKISWWQKVRSPLFGGLAVLKNIGNKTQQMASSMHNMPAAPPFIKTTVVPQVPIDQKMAKVVPMAKEMILPKNAQGAVGDMASFSSVIDNQTINKLQPVFDAPPIKQLQPIVKDTPMPIDFPILDPVQATSTVQSTSTPKIPKSIISVSAPKGNFIPIHSNPYLEVDTKILESPQAVSSSTLADFVFYSTQTFDFEYDLNGIGWRQSGESLSLVDLAQGENRIMVRAVKKGEADSTPSEFKWFVDSIAPEINFEIKPDDYISSTSSIFKFSSNENAFYGCNMNDAGWQDCEEDFVVDGLQEGEQILELRAHDDVGNIASLSFGWLIDLTAPTSSLSLDPEYYEPDFLVSWSGGDSGSTTPSGVESFDLDYRLESGDWQEWLRDSTSTSAVFAGNYGDIIYFRSQAKDRAGNISDWSGGERVEIIDPIADHIVISQVRIGGNSASDEFVELYNPTDDNISLAGYKLKRKTASGQEYNLVSDFGVAGIAAKSYYLVAHPIGFISSTTPDIMYSSASYGIASDNTVLLYNGIDVIDKVGFGSVSDYERIPFAVNPPDGQGLTRKSSASSTAESLVDSSAYDTNINSNDFLLNASSSPRNSDYIKDKNKIKIDNISSSQNDWEMSFSWSHTVNASDAILVVSVHADNMIGSVTYGGVEMSLATESVRRQAFNSVTSYIYTLNNPPQGPNEVTVNAAYTAYMNATAMSLSNHDIINPIAFVFSELDAKQHVLNSAGTTTNGMIIDSVTYNHYEDELIADDGQTVFYNFFRAGQVNNILAGDSYKFISSPNETMGWSISRDMSYVYTMIVIKGK